MAVSIAVRLRKGRRRNTRHRHTSLQRLRTRPEFYPPAVDKVIEERTAFVPTRPFLSCDETGPMESPGIGHPTKRNSIFLLCLYIS